MHTAVMCATVMPSAAMSSAAMSSAAMFGHGLSRDHECCRDCGDESEFAYHGVLLTQRENASSDFRSRPMNPV
jgi:hypothetical protein